MSYSSNGKHCVNCVYWQGSRAKRPGTGLGAWESEHNTTTGQCAMHVRLQTSASEGSNCAKYQEMPR